MPRVFWLTLIFFLTIIIFSCNQCSISHTTEMVGMEAAMSHEFKMTRDPQLNRIPSERLIAANAYMESINSGIAVRGQGVAALTWQERGPNNIGGRTRAIVVDKNDATGNTVIAASVSGGMFKTTNFTNAVPVWTPINDMLPNLAVTCIVQHQ